MKKILIIILSLGVCIGIFLALYKKADSPALSEIKSFEDCVKAGYAVMESYPRQCKTPDGRTFAEEITPPITYKNTSKDKIVVDMPFPGAVTGKEFEVRGKAAGWYFEASFPVTVLDKDGKILFQGPATAQGDWMTAEFVPFKVTVKIPQTYIGPATLVLQNDNPSDMRELDQSISFPITIEY
ncbi:MAG: hypothetical protein AB198_01980 [Parcubacteria bacterium C7867-003]|nr:MAG: hypothetical protein AB198_01980 [Parcubacteria bacterium C7867-003]